ncbi:MAG: DNA repair protein RadA [Gammaproteobacteria bacterium]
MARANVQFQCQECGAAAPKWSGQCPECAAWNTMTEVIVEDSRGGKHPSRFRTIGSSAAAISSLEEVEPSDGGRIRTGIAELDRAIGGGVVAGSVVLIGGDPGIGKSTLLIQTLSAMTDEMGVRTLYVTGEESVQQVSLRARRLGLNTNGLRVLTETNIEGILKLASVEQPQVMVIDSIQTVYTDSLQSAPGAVAQVRESAAQLVRYAKQTGTAIFLVGHVTKEGALAGPRVLEHMVDTVLYFEGDSGSRIRVIRAVKNRFGAVNELGVFAMTDKGLREVSNPSAIFLSRHAKDVAGSVIMVTREGTRPLLVEVQALVDASHLSNPRRVTVGLESNRLAMLLAVFHRHGGVATYDQDVFVNVVGGVRISETGADLAILLAVLSSLRDRPLPRDLVVFGEVGLAGEIRPVQNGPERLREAAKHGFQRAIVPAANAPKKGISGIAITGLTRIQEALESLS